MTESNSFNFNNIVSYTYTETSITFIDKDGETITGTLDTSKNITVGGQIIGQLAENGNLIPAGQTAENTDFLHCKNGQFVNMGTADIQSLVYTYDNETKTGSITYTDSNGIEYEFGLGEGSDGGCSIIDARNNIVGNFNLSTLQTQFGTLQLDFMKDSNDKIWCLNNIEIASISYRANNLNQLILTITDTNGNSYSDNLYQFNGLYNSSNYAIQLDVSNKKLIMGVGDSAQEIEYDGDNFISSSNSDTFLHKDYIHELQIKSVSYNLEGDNPTVTIIDANNIEYTIGVEFDEEKQMWNLEGESGLLDLNNQKLILGSGDNTTTVDFNSNYFISSPGNTDLQGAYFDGRYLEPSMIKIFSYEIENNVASVTITDMQNNEYVIELNETTSQGVYNNGFFGLTTNNNHLYYYDINNDQAKVDCSQFIDVGNNTYWDKEALQKHLKEIGIDSISYDIESENKTITITDTDGNKYTMTLTQLNGQWKLPGDLGTLYPTTKTLILGSGESMQNINFGTSMIDVGNNTYWDKEALQKHLKEIGIDSISYDIESENKTITITDTDGNKYTMTLTQLNGQWKLPGDLGTLYPTKKTLTLGSGESMQNIDFGGHMIDVGNNTYWYTAALQKHLKEIGIDSISYDIKSENKTITITDTDGNEYTMSLFQVSGQWRLPGVLGTLDVTKKTLTLGSGESMQNINFGTSMINVGNNTYWDKEALQKHLKEIGIDSISYDIESENKTITITDTDGNKYTMELTLDDNQWKLPGLGTLNANTKILTLGSGQDAKMLNYGNSLISVGNNSYISKDVLSKVEVKSISYDLENNPPKLFMTDTSGKDYEIILQKINGEDSKYLLPNNAGILDTATKELVLGDDINNQQSINFGQDFIPSTNSNTFLSKEHIDKLEVQSISYNLKNGDPSITITDVDGNKYEIGLMSGKDGEWILSGDLGTLDPTNKKLTLGSGESAQSIAFGTSMIDVGNNTYWNKEALQEHLKEMDIASISYNVEGTNGTITITGADGNEYTMSLNKDGDKWKLPENLGTCNLDNGSLSIGTPPTTYGNDLISVGNNQFYSEDKLEDILKGMDIASISYDIESENKTITITGADGNEYTMSLNKDGDEWKLPGNLGILDTQNQRLILGNGENQTVTDYSKFIKTMNNEYLKPDIEIQAFKYDLNAETITILDEFGTSYDIELTNKGYATYEFPNGSGSLDVRHNVLKLGSENIINYNSDFVKTTIDNQIQYLNPDNMDVVDINLTDTVPQITIKNPFGGGDIKIDLEAISGKEKCYSLPGGIGEINTQDGSVYLSEDNKFKYIKDNNKFYKISYDAEPIELNDIKSVTVDAEHNSLSILSADGKTSTNYELQAIDNNTYYIVDKDGNTIGVYDKIQNKILSAMQDGQTTSIDLDNNNYIVSTDNVYVNLDKLDIDNFVGYKIDSQSKVIEIDGYKFNIDNSENNIYTIGGCSNLSINPVTATITKNGQQFELPPLYQTTNGYYLNMANLDVDKASYNYNPEDVSQNNLNIVSKTGVEYTFKIEPNTETGKYNIKDADGRIIGEMSVNENDTVIDFSQSGGKSFTMYGEQSKLYTLSEGEKDIFSDIFASDNIIKSFADKQDWGGLKKYIGNALEDLSGKDVCDEEVLEMAKNIIISTEVKNIKSYQEFLDKLNDSLEKKGFDTLENTLDNILDNSQNGTLEEDTVKIASNLMKYGVAGMIGLALVSSVAFAASKSKSTSKGKGSSGIGSSIKKDRIKLGSPSGLSNHSSGGYRSY